MSGIGRGFRALRSRNYRLFWGGQVLSQSGSWMQSTAQGWLVLSLTDSPVAVGMVAALQFTPALLFGLLGGVVADRVDRYRGLFVTQFLAAGLAFAYALLVSRGEVGLTQVYVLAMVLGLVNAFDNPLRQSFVPGLVSREELPNAIALNSVTINVARVAGPAVAGVLIATAGLEWAFWFNAGSYGAILGGLALMDRGAMVRRAGGGGRGAVLHELPGAFREIGRRPRVMLALILMACFGVFGYNFNTMVPLIGGFVLGLDPVRYGGLTSAQGLGAVAGALAVGSLGAPSVRRLFWAGAVFALAVGCCALVPVYGVVAGFFALMGASAVGLSTAANTMVQLGVPEEVRGRAMSVYWTVFAGTTPFGALFLGGMASWVGVPGALALCGGLCGLGLVAGWWYWRGRGVEEVEGV